MTGPLPILQLVDSSALPEHTVSADERLDSHYFIQWNLKRWRKSQFRQLAEPEVGWFGFLLFCEAHDETPVGTLPVSEELLAKALGITIERWRQLCARKITPLHNWTQALCDNGEVRLVHPVVTEVVRDALDRRDVRKASSEGKAVYQRQQRLSEAMRDIGCDKAVCADRVLIERLDAWLLENHHGQRRMPQFEASITRALRHAAEQGWMGRVIRKV